MKDRSKNTDPVNDPNKKSTVDDARYGETEAQRDKWQTEETREGRDGLGSEPEATDGQPERDDRVTGPQR